MNIIKLKYKTRDNVIHFYIVNVTTCPEIKFMGGKIKCPVKVCFFCFVFLLIDDKTVKKSAVCNYKNISKSSGWDFWI